MHQRTAGILSVGDELILGQTLDTNSRWLAQRLVDAGIMPHIHVTVPDTLEAQRDTLRSLASRVDVVVCSGGLGPTADDLTREALAGAMGTSLELDPVSLSQVEAWFVSRGRQMASINRVQAMIPGGARAIPNLNGTAPGIHGAVGGCEVFCLPGPPREMMPMFESHVLPRLRPDPAAAITTRTVHTFGIGESDLAQRLGDLMNRDARPTVGTTASGGVVSIRIRLQGEAASEESARVLHECESRARAAAGVYAFGSGDETIASCIVRLLQETGSTVGTVESCTGGGLGAILTQVAGSSMVYAGGFTTYSNELKTRLAGVPESMFATGGPGAVSGACALALARGGVERLGVHHALAITGVAGPGGGSKEKPVGTVWISRASRDGTSDTRRFLFSGDRAFIRDLAAKSALAMMRLRLVGAEAPLLREAERFTP
ncbi:MAG: competence/damage-inducible protein A [Phycisphaerae bacterium]